jgi:hypothetical protein
MKLSDTLTIKRPVYKRGKHVKGQAIDEQVPAKFYGPLAVHLFSEATNYSKASYSLTHRATGLRILGELTLQQAQRIAKQLQGDEGWSDERLAHGRTVATKELFDRMRDLVLQAKRDHGADADYNLRKKWRM